MAKSSIVYVCSECGYSSPKWLGKCTSCGTWDSFSELVISKKPREKIPGIGRDKPPVPVVLSEVDPQKRQRISSGDRELDNVLGGGIVPGSVVLLGGQPGIGKSTLLLQLALRTGMPTLYISGEESEEQIKLRAGRLAGSQDRCFLFTSSLLEEQLAAAGQLKPSVVIVDSIQTVSSESIDNAPGSVTQVRHCAAVWQKYAKESHIPVFLVGHITKGGYLAGPKLLEHLVDTVLQFEGDAQYHYRMIRSVKNRFGSTDELGIYQMTAAGLEPVDNPGELLTVSHELGLSGSAIAASVEGQRALLVEVQALVAASPYGTPQRTGTGFDSKRMAMLLAVLEKRCGMFFAQQDIFINLAGGFRIQDPGVDAAVVCALLSSHQNIPLPKGWCAAGEVGLAGEVRAVQRLEQRIQEAERRGFKKMIIPGSGNMKTGSLRTRLEIFPVQQVAEIQQLLFSSGA